MKKKRYSWVPGAKIKGVSPQKAGEEIDRLLAKYGQSLKAEQVLEEARSKKSPIHNAFDWNDTTAARAYRLEQARRLLRSVRVVIITPKGSEITTRVTVTTEDPEESGRVYSATEYAMSSEKMRNSILRQALAELKAFRHKYATLSELASLFKQIDVLSEKLIPKNGKNHHTTDGKNGKSSKRKRKEDEDRPDA